jgi:hypothetical protein
MDQLKIFISSTQNDLKFERDAIEKIIGQFGHVCLRAETYDSPGTSPEHACRNMANECDIYVGIYGSKYGFVSPNIGISATEMEYQAAREHNPGKIFIYIKESDNYENDQGRFLKEVQDFALGYFRHLKFNNPVGLGKQFQSDLVTWTTRRIRDSIIKDIEIRALRDKIRHFSRVMELYGIPEDLR